MPIYTFICKNCSRRFDILIGKEELKCPECGCKELIRVLGSFKIFFSGSFKKACSQENCSRCRNCF